MKVSYDWLSDYVTHELSPEDLAEKLTMGGLEVDDLDIVGQSYDHVVVGRVEEVKDHPNADRLRLCMVDVGQPEKLQIACGAPNVDQQQLVPVALEGATVQMPDRDQPGAYIPITIKKTKLRGETSEGMICAEDELSLSENHEGIMVLNGDASVGQSFAEYLREQHLPARDAIYNIDLTPNRPDAASHIGVARDVAALTGTNLTRPKTPTHEDGGEIAEKVDITIKDPEGCPRYVAMIVQNVTVAESPRWLRHRLKSIGLRPRNNIVDITNFVMHECGQPLHAFDMDRLAGPGIVVQSTDREQSFTTLDDTKRTLPENTLMICDVERPVAIAGIMGGQNSEVSSDTKNVLIESAYFDPATIRRTAKALQLSTDASYRYERGVDPELQPWAAARAAQLMVDIAGGELLPGRIDKHPRPIPRVTVTVRPERVAAVLGVDLSADRIAYYLDAVGCEAVKHDDDTLTCTVPSFRPDITREIDLIEEVARLYGYNNIPEPKRSPVPNRPPKAQTERRMRGMLRSRLAGLGFREVYTNSMLREETAEQFLDNTLSHAETDASVVQTLNPTSREMAALRPSLLPGMLEVMAHNHHHGRDILRFMEFGHVFRRSDQSATLIPGYSEQQSFILAVSGPAHHTNWDADMREVDFYDLKGIVETLVDTLHLDNFEAVSYPEPTPTTAYRLELWAGNDYLGVVARLRDEIGDAYDLTRPVFFAECNLEALIAHTAPQWNRRYEPVPRFPRVRRDLAVVVSDRRPVGEMIESIEKAGAPLLKKAEIFDVYAGEHIQEGQKSVAFSLEFGADHTLVDEEVDHQVKTIVEELENAFNAELRQ